MPNKAAARKPQRMLLAPATSRLIDEEPRPLSTRAGNALAWIHEALERDATYIHRRMFGCEAAYLHGLLYLVTAAKDEPWNGLLVCTSKERHGSLTSEWPGLRPHQILGKWLYVSQDHPAFEAIAHPLLRAVLSRDPRMGVEPKPKKRRRKKKNRSVLPKGGR